MRFVYQPADFQQSTGIRAGAVDARENWIAVLHVHVCTQPREG